MSGCDYKYGCVGYGPQWPTLSAAHTAAWAAPVTPDPSRCSQEVTPFQKVTLWTVWVCTIADALWTKAKHSRGCLQAIQAPFFCGVDKHLLYALADEIQRATCGSKLFFKCMFRTWKTKNKSICDNFLEYIQIMGFHTLYVALLTWKSYRNSEVFMTVTARRELLISGNWYLPTEILVQFGEENNCDS